MLTITGYRECINSENKSFFTLTLESGIEMIQSQKTGQFYASSKRATITSTFNEDVCKSLVGTTIAGRIEKMSCDPYSYVIPETGEQVELSHRYSYVPNEETNHYSEPERLSNSPKVAIEELELAH